MTLKLVNFTDVQDHGNSVLLFKRLWTTEHPGLTCCRRLWTTEHRPGLLQEVVDHVVPRPGLLQEVVDHGAPRPGLLQEATGVCGPVIRYCPAQQHTYNRYCCCMWVLKWWVRRVSWIAGREGGQRCWQVICVWEWRRGYHYQLRCGAKWARGEGYDRGALLEILKFYFMCGHRIVQVLLPLWQDDLGDDFIYVPRNFEVMAL